MGKDCYKQLVIMSDLTDLQGFEEGEWDYLRRLTSWATNAVGVAIAISCRMENTHQRKKGKRMRCRDRRMKRR